MNPELWYKVINLIILPAWLLLLFAPRAQFTHRYVHAAFIPLVLVILYTYFLAGAMFFGKGAEGTGFTTLAGVMALFDSPVATLAGWTHYLVFDLFVGMWIARDAQRTGIAHVWVVPCLVFACLLGPVGLGLYLLLRAGLSNRGFLLDELSTTVGARNAPVE